MTLQEILQQAKSEVDLDQRERAFRSIIEAHPDFDQGHLELARLLERTKQLEEALDITSYLLRRRPAHHPTLNLHTVLLRDLGNLDTCEKITKRWKEHHADKVQPLIRLGEIARQRHQPDLEFEYFRKAHELQPGHYWLNHRLAVLYEQRDELDQAQQYYELVRDADSEHIQTYRLGVRLSISQSDYARGLAIGALGRERHPDDWALGLAIAKCMQRAGLIHEQGSMLDRLEVRHPNEFAVLRDQGHRYRTLQHRQMAISYYKKAAIVATRPRQTRDATVEAAREYLAMGDYAQALQMSHEVLDKFPRTVSAEMVMARAQTSLHDYTSAIKTYRSILEHMPDFPGAILHLGIVYRQRHDFDASLEVLLSSKEVKATDPRFSTHKAITLIQAERFYEAKEELDQLVTLFPDHAEGYVRLAHLHKRFGDQQMAIQTIENGIASCKSAERLLLGHVDILMHFGELDAAQELLSESESKISSPEWNWRMAQLLRRLGDFDSADSHLAKLPKQTKAWRIRVLHRSAEHAFQSYNYSKAHEILDQLITEEPYQPRHLLRKAVSHMLFGDIEVDMVPPLSADPGSRAL
ncbi:MAG: tetratricopeptide repeat protein, partial [Bacteroidota bacterium]